MTHRHELIVLGQALLTLGLMGTVLLTPAQPPSAAPARHQALQAHAASAPVAPAKSAPRTDKAPVPAASISKALTPDAPVVSESTASPPPLSETAAPTSEPVASLDSAHSMPALDANYRRARRQLLAKGFRPTRVAPPECRGPEPSVDACWGPLVEFPEIEACSSGAKGACVGWWLAPDGRVLNIKTAGDSARIRDRHWASDGEIAELPSGWRP